MTLKNIFKDKYGVLTTLVHYIIYMDLSLSSNIKWMKLNETKLKIELTSQYISSFIKKLMKTKY